MIKVNFRSILDGLVEGREREAILGSPDARVSAELAASGRGLAFDLDPHSRWLLAEWLDRYDSLSERVQRLDRQIETVLAPWDERLRLLQTIPGIDRASACAIHAEVGPNLSPFARSRNWVAWAGGRSGHP